MSCQCLITLILPESIIAMRKREIELTGMKPGPRSHEG